MYKYGFLLIALNLYLLQRVCAEQAQDDSMFVTNGTMVWLKNSRYYFETSTRVNWFQALVNCRIRGMNLVSILSSLEQETIDAAITELGYLNRRFWTSGTDFPERKNHMWFPNGRPFNYTYWEAGEPSFTYGSVEEHCIELRDEYDLGTMKWNDNNCEASHYYICEF